MSNAGVECCVSTRFDWSQKIKKTVFSNGVHTGAEACCDVAPLSMVSLKTQNSVGWQGQTPALCRFFCSDHRKSSTQSVMLQTPFPCEPRALQCEDQMNTENPHDEEIRHVSSCQLFECLQECNNRSQHKLELSCASHVVPGCNACPVTNTSLQSAHQCAHANACVIWHPWRINNMIHLTFIFLKAMKEVCSVSIGA